MTEIVEKVADVPAPASWANDAPDAPRDSGENPANNQSGFTAMPYMA
jgi:hypothetical protein